jgi:hypothetical protein
VPSVAFLQLLAYGKKLLELEPKRQKRKRQLLYLHVSEMTLAMEVEIKVMRNCKI